MDSDKNFDKTKQRLKELREQKCISHEALSRMLKEQYGVQISGQRLRDYEIMDKYNVKYSSTQGMGIKYLCVLADFYNVTADYLLGNSDIPTRNETTIGIHKETGLSQKAITTLQVEKALKDDCIADFISFLIENESLKTLIASIVCSNATSVQKECLYIPTSSDLKTFFTGEVPVSTIYKFHSENIFREIVCKYKYNIQEAE